MSATSSHGTDNNRSASAITPSTAGFLGDKTFIYKDTRRGNKKRKAMPNGLPQQY